MKKIFTIHLLTAVLLTVSAATFAAPPIINIPASPCNMVISGQEAECLTDCVIPTNCTLTVENGAHVVFYGNLTISPGAVMIVNDAKAVEFAPGKRLLVKGGTWLTEPPVPAGKLLAQQGRFYRYGDVNSDPWKGIETEVDADDPMPLGAGGVVELTDCLIKDADVAIRNYNSDFPPLLTAGGSIECKDVVFMNSVTRSLDLYNDYWAAGWGDPEGVLNLHTRFHRCSFEFNNQFQGNPLEMVRLRECNAIPFYACSFNGYNSPSADVLTAIRATNSGFLVLPYQGSNSDFQNVERGIYVVSTPDLIRRVIIRKANFSARYSILLRGCRYPLIIDNEIMGINSYETTAGIYLDNCLGHWVEGNTLGRLNAGIIVRNCGATNTTVYRNKLFSIYDAGIQSIGTNVDETGLSGLKIFCNNISCIPQFGNNDFWDISVVNNPGDNTTWSGVHARQYVVYSWNPQYFKSAANRFSQSGNTSLPYNYYREDEPNVQELVYRYSQLVSNEEPVYRNVPAFVSPPYECEPVYPYADGSPFPFGAYPGVLSGMETTIDSLESLPALSADDSIHLDYMLDTHSRYIDRMLLYYTSVQSLDTVIMGLRLVTKGGSRYPELLAAAFASLHQYDSAAGVLEDYISGASLSPDEQNRLENIISMYGVMQDLSLVEDDWDSLAPAQKAIAATYADEDMFDAGTMARALMAQYENALYDPVWKAPQGYQQRPGDWPDENQDDLIYPSPAGNTLFVRNNSGRTLALYDLSGRLIARYELTGDITPINISRLSPGVYIADIEEHGRRVYHQKIVKR